ncbi:SOS response-associated peptidase [Ensifer soli]|uniref:SOS response-associated peptidase n=1 Tax=Ciceribacter sp. sgz301302 TaxID=3342379 RepID=UPI0035BB5EDF
MCGRYALTATPGDVAEAFGLAGLEAFPPRYNIAPTQPILVVRAGEKGPPGSNLPERRALLARWGFTPAWVKDPATFPLLINARSETAAEKASFRAAMRHRRIVVPASGFYEWHRPAKGSGLPSQAYWVHPRRGGLVAFGGVMETWASADGSEVDTVAILTTRATGPMAAVHERMPVVIAQEEMNRWLDCLRQEPRDVADLMRPPPEDAFELIPVSDRVNKVSDTHPDIQAPVVPQPVKGETPGMQKPRSSQLSLF